MATNSALCHRGVPTRSNPSVAIPGRAQRGASAAGVVMSRRNRSVSITPVRPVASDDRLACRDVVAGRTNAEVIDSATGGVWDRTDSNSAKETGVKARQPPWEARLVARPRPTEGIQP